MNRFFYFISAILLTTTLVLGQTEKLKKIVFIKSNNQPIENYFEQLSFPKEINTENLTLLKNYIQEKEKFNTKKEPEFFIELMNWVSNQWEHDGWNKAPDSLTAYDILKNVEKGTQYRCVEYGKVLNEALQAFGYISRSVGLRAIDVAYGGAGRGHVATEVWSNKLEKWIFLDPQFSIYPMHNNVPLNIYDMYKLKSESKFDEINFVALKTAEKEQQIEGYKNFIKNYLGYISISQNNGDLKYNLMLKMEGKEDHITFQSFPNNNLIFTSKTERVYFKLNQTNVFFQFSESERQRANDEFEKLNIKTLEAFNKNMFKFAAKPDLVIKITNNMPWFDHYKVELNNSLQEVDGDTCKFKLKEGKNSLRVWSVNKAGIAGIVSEFLINYE